MSTSSTAVLDRQPAATPRFSAGPALAVIATCYLMVVLDTTVVNVALPKIQTSLHFSGSGLAWVFNAYMLTFGGMLLLGGRAGDILGRRRVMVTGITLFTAASLFGGLAPSAGWLVAARAVQGVGGSLVSPSALALIASNFPEGHPRNRALSLYSAIAGAGASIGLILGGLLTDLASWRWVLFINLPVGVAMVLLAPRFLQETEPHPGRFDLAGALTGTVGVTAAVYGLIRASTDGWSDRATVAAFVVALGVLAAFRIVEGRAAQPILPLRLFADRNRASAYLTMLLIPATMFGAFFFLTQFLQNVLGYAPLAGGVAFLPLALTMLVTVRSLPRLLPRFGPKPIMTVGAVLITLACGWLLQLDATSGYAGGVLGPLVLLGVGIACSVLPLNVVILSGVSGAEAGAASGLLQTMQWVGGSLGLAVLVTVFGTTSRGTHPVAGRIPAAEQALAHGIAGAFTAAAVFAACAVLVVIFAVRPARPLQTAGPAMPAD